MGTTLTGTTPQDTYDSLIKVTDNGPLSGTLKALSDGLGNDSTLSLSTTAASIAGTLVVSGDSTFSGIVTANQNGNTFGNASLSGRAVIVQANSTNQAIMFKNNLNGDGTLSVGGDATSLDYIFNTYSTSDALAIKNNGSVGIGTSSPYSKVTIHSTASSTLGLNSQTGLVLGQGGNTNDIVQIGFNQPLQSTYSPASIGYAITNASASTYGDLVFGTRSVNSDTAPTERMRILSSGGITFNGDTSVNNALSDYEQGTWTPTDGSGAGLTITNNGSRYTKIGNVVNISLDITYPSTANASDMAIIGVPFTIAADGGASVGYTTFAPAIPTFVQTANSVNGFRLQNGGGGTISNATMSTVRIQISATYFV